MKVLVVQLARLGDILMTVPSLRAMVRTHPDWEITLLVRKKFRAAARWAPESVKIIELDSEQIIGPVLSEPPDWAKSEAVLADQVRALRDFKFDIVVNLTFSAASSFLVHSLEVPSDNVRGYTRHSDGFLNIPDDPSAFYYAQVGERSFNRLHLSHIFSQVAGVELQDKDWGTHLGSSSNHVAVHIGAAQTQKSLSPEKWADFLGLLVDRTEFDFILVGSPEEVPVAARIKARVSSSRIVDRVGQTSFETLDQTLTTCRCLIGADSSVSQLASLLGVPVLGINIGTPNAWETGPISFGSRTLFLSSEEACDFNDLVREFDLLASEKPSLWRSLRSFGPLDPPVPNFVGSGEREWNLIQFIYMGKHLEFEISASEQTLLLQMDEVNELCLEHIGRIQKRHELEISSGLLSRSEELLTLIFRQSPLFGPILGWWNTEKVRIGPGSLDQIAAGTRQVHLGLRTLIHNLRKVAYEASDLELRKDSI